MPKYTPASPYLRRFDLPANEDTIVTILWYERQDMRAKRIGRVRRAVLYFVERPECLALNNPNGKTLCDLFGDDMDDWVGKQIALFVDPSVRVYGVALAGIRIRPHTITRRSDSAA